MENFLISSQNEENEPKEKQYCDYVEHFTTPKNDDSIENINTCFVTSPGYKLKNFSPAEQSTELGDWSFEDAFDLPASCETNENYSSTNIEQLAQENLFSVSMAEEISNTDECDDSDSKEKGERNPEPKLPHFNSQISPVGLSTSGGDLEIEDNFAVRSAASNCRKRKQTQSGDEQEVLPYNLSEKYAASSSNFCQNYETFLPSAISNPIEKSVIADWNTINDKREDINRASSVGNSTCSGLTNEMSIARKNRLPDKKLLADIVRRYLRKRDDMKVVIWHAKVAQKSYGTEKRFFCPPPCVHLLGKGWKTKRRRKAGSSMGQSHTPSSASVGASEICLFMGVGGSGNELQQMYFDLPDKGYAAARTLHTPDSDKRKNFQIHVKLFYGDGSEIGLFQSQRIKVISKPSKKKQTVKNTDLCIPSGSKVALFNRLRSQTVSTRYLYVNKDGYKASASQWGAFTIHLGKQVDSNDPESEQFDVEEGYIHYGATVKLVCSVTGYALPRVIIRKVDKQVVILDSDEPISQLHKCALYLKDSDRQYLCLSQEKIIAHAAQPSSKHPNMDKLTDGGCWTIISTDQSEYSWTDSAFNLINNVSVTPVPVVKNLEINGGGEYAMAELSGEDFSPNLTIWFADVEAETMFRCNECLVCVVPDISKFQPTWKYVKKTVKVPLLLVREDGVVYPSGINFYYTPEIDSKRAKKIPSVKKILKKKQLLGMPKPT